MPMLIHVKKSKKVQTNFDQAGREIGLTVFNIIRTNLKLKSKTEKDLRELKGSLFYSVFSSTSFTAL
jgi:hypothetical protein